MPLAVFTLVASMSSIQIATSDAAPTSTPSALKKLLAHAGRIIMRRRVVLTSLIVVLMLAEDIWNGLRPHNVLDWTDHYTQVGIGLVVCGLALRTWAVGILRKGSQLTTTGPYRMMRNPLYLGSFLLMLGFATIIDDAENLWVILGPMLALYYFKVREEERGLAARFGAQWTAYSDCTPRLVPRRLSLDRTADWRMSQWMLSREYRAPLSVLAGLAALYVWRCC